MHMRRRGFTLIELLVVIGLISLFITIVLAAISNAKEKGDNTKTRSQLASLSKLAEEYYVLNDGYGNTVT
mgnify:CR=1 FL=1